MSKKLISIVLPSYNEEKNISLVYASILEHFDTKEYDYEMIFVNDGSRDGTWDSISALAGKDSHILGINFSRNFGHHAALQAGLEVAKGDAVIMLDADLQHPPKLIPVLLEKWESGYDVVNTVREMTEDAGALKNFTSKMFYRTLNSVSDLQLNDGEADYRLLSRRALDTLNSLPESPKFYRGLVNWIGYNVAHVSYVAEARRHGKSSYTLKKMIELARMGLTSFSMKPLKFIISFGATLSFLSLFGLFIMLVVKLGISRDYFSNNAVLVMFLVFMTGLLTTFQGIVAIYLVDIFNEAKGRPPYIISDKVGSKSKES